MSFRFLALNCLIFLLSACGVQATVTSTLSSPIPSGTDISETAPKAPSTGQPVVTQMLTAVTVVPQLASCNEWQFWPVVPVATKTARELYQRGLINGNDPHAFSKIGDGEISAEWFFAAFDLGNYDLGTHQELSSVIEYFGGSYRRTGVAARRGFNTKRILDLAERNVELCEPSESPLTCELRLHRPAFAILSLGTNQVWQPEEFERGMRQILNLLVSQNVVPILSTKGDNLEGDQRINRTIACLAQEYDLPLWNFWAAIQPLPNHGLQPDLEHLTYGITDFDDPHAMQSAWTARNLTALQVLDAVWRGVTK